MNIGLPKESKEGERRVALLPEAVATLVAPGARVLVETCAGMGVGANDEAYRAAGARIVTADEAWRADVVVKVKEIQEADLAHLPDGAALFSFQHLPGEPARTRELAARHATAIAFEMVRDARGGFPLLAPMSQIAGRMALQQAARLLGRAPRQVLVLGAGHAGLSAAAEAKRMGAQVVVLTRSARSCDEAKARGFEADIALPQRIEEEALEAEVVVGAVFLAATPTPKLLPRSLVSRMLRGSVIADISIDAGGVAETSHPTTHADPSFVEEGVIHYCVANIPAAAPAEAAAALSAAVLPYVQAIASLGLGPALLADPGLRAGVLLWRGGVNHPGIAAEAGLPYTALADDDLR
ncbi:MAG TPA: FAD-dependent oxidoreductase [Usitatibacter sp.]|nr:FAD-dependent oxidoreductase [Usitatibacter sp.]